MCGISVLISRQPDPQADRPALRQMAEAQRHRGPDGEGFLELQWPGEWIGFGHNHLAITDSHQAAPQPFVSEDRQCGLVYNGELYNTENLARRLEESGTVFRTRSDTEVLLEWIRRFGRRGLAELEGMYAFVFWDQTRKFLLIHRDRYGIKPLWYARSRRYLAFASEPRAILGTGFFSVTANPEALAGLLKYRFLPPGLSPWLAVHEVLPGEVIEYWESKPMHYTVPAEGPAGNIPLAAALRESCRSVFPVGEPFGLMLSGGVDSTLLLLEALDSGLPFRAYSIRQDSASPLRADQEAVTSLHKRYGFSLTWVDFGPEEIARVLSPGNEPPDGISDPAWYLTRAIARRAREEGIRILISGAGADEWFGGYRRHEAFYRVTGLSGRIPEMLRPLLARLLSAGGSRWKGLPDLSPAAIWDRVVSGMWGQVIGGAPVLDLDPHPGGPVAAGLRWDQTRYLPGDVLAVTDRATMAEGVEGRFPFLHPVLTRWADARTVAEKMANGRKTLLMEHIAKRMGSDFGRRPKQGFGIPLAAYYSTPAGRKQVEEGLRVLRSAPEAVPDGEGRVGFEKKLLADPGKYPLEVFGMLSVAALLRG
jgi:asparagine synthase (glutamine-hydrolysing)